MANVLERVLRVGEGRTLRRLKNYAEAVNHLEDAFSELTDDELRNETVELRERYAAGESLEISRSGPAGTPMSAPETR